jgi:AraC-like DNA-binding protein
MSPWHTKLREMLDDRLFESFTIAEGARILDVHPSHLVRAFSKAYGIAPYRYVTGRRVDRARRLLLDGTPASEAAVEAGFHDQAHLTRHFRRVLGTTPGAFAA